MKAKKSSLAKDPLNKFGRADLRGRIFQRKAQNAGNSPDYCQVLQRRDGKFWPQSGRT